MGGAHSGGARVPWGTRHDATEGREELLGRDRKFWA